MERRAFLRGVGVAAFAVALPTFDTTVDDDEEIRASYEAFRQRLIVLHRQLTKDGYEVKGWELGPLHDGVREARIFLSGSILVWDQNWEGDRI
jgi:hypothetical protein